MNFDETSREYDRCVDELVDAINQLDPEQRITVRRRVLALQTAHNDMIAEVVAVLDSLHERIAESGGKVSNG